MTNLDIIANARKALIANGTLQPEDVIHTFNGWKEQGFKVKKGEHAIAQFSIWKHKGKKVEKEDGTEIDKSFCFLKNSYWFTQNQVEPMKGV